MKKSKLKATTASVAVAAAVLGTTSVANVAHADEMTPEEATVAQPSNTQTPPVTQQDVDSAKSDVDSAQKEANDSDKALSDAQTNVDSAKDNVDKAEKDLEAAEKVNDEATPEKIEQAETDVTNAEKDVADAQTEVDKAQSESDTANTNKNDAQTAVDNVQKEFDTANINADKAQTDVDKAQTDVTDAENQVATDEKDVTDAQTAVDSNQTAVDEAQKKADDAAAADQEAEKAKTDAKTELDEAKKTQIEKETDKNTAQTNVDNQQKVVDDAAKATQAAKDELAAQSETKYPVSMDLSQEWVNAFNSFKNSIGTADEVTKRNALDAITSAEFQRIQKAFAEQASLNKDKIYDVNNLDTETQNKLNQYLVTLINSIHKALVDGKTVQANTNLIKFANDLAAQYQIKQNGMGAGHDLDAIKAAAKENNLAETPYNPYENLNNDISYTEKVSEYDLYKMVYDTIASMFPGDSMSKYGHALSLLGSDTLGMSINSYEDTKDSTGIPGAYVQEIHIVNVPDARFVMIPGTADETRARYENLYGVTSSANLKSETTDTAALQAAVDAAIENEKTANAQLTALKAVLKDATDALTTAQTNVVSAQAKYDTLVNAPTESNQAQKELADAKASLEKAQANLADAKTKLTNSKESLKGKLAALVNAQDNKAKADETKAQKQTALTSAKATLAEAVTKAEIADSSLASATKKLNDAYAALSVAHTVLNDLKNAQANYDKALDAYNDALAQQLVAELAYDIAMKNSNDAHAKLDTVKTTYNQIYSQYLLQQTIDNSKENPSTGNSDNTTEQVKLNTSVKPNKADTNSRFVPLTETRMERYHKTSASVLPQTGSNDNAGLAILGISLAAIAVAPFRRKRHQ